MRSSHREVVFCDVTLYFDFLSYNENEFLILPFDPYKLIEDQIFMFGISDCRIWGNVNLKKPLLSLSLRLL